MSVFFGHFYASFTFWCLFWWS